MTAQPSQTQAVPVGIARWEIDPAHSLAEFAVRHMMVSTVKGRFATVRGHVDFDPADLSTASIEGEIDVASIDTRDEKRDAHLRSADFFDAETYPTITFKSRRVEVLDDDRVRVVGDLTIRGVTREVVLDGEFAGVNRNPWGQWVAGFSGTTTIDRKDFGLNWNVALETGGVLVADKVKISLEIEAVRQG